jgi:hypothetical protein
VWHHHSTGGTTTRILILKNELGYSISEPSQGEVPFGGLKTPNPRQEVKSAVIHIYSLALHELFFPLAYLLFCISIRKEKQKFYCIMDLKPHMNDFHGV